MKARKMAAVLLTLVMATGILNGCGTDSNTQTASGSDTVAETGTGETEISPEETTEDNTEETVESTTENTAEDAAETTSAESGKTLVVYYSASGNTKGVAETIAQVTDGDLFEIEPVNPYTDEDLNWAKNDSRVSREHDDESLRDVELVSTIVDNWDSYDTVYIGYPIWWGIAAWPVDGFVKANDFTGKTVIPFYTASSSEIGESGNLLRDMAGTGDWKDGERFHGGASEADIRAWIDSLGL